MRHHLGEYLGGAFLAIMSAIISAIFCRVIRRCVGSAMAAGIELLDCAMTFGAARLITFTGGPSVGGAGAIVGKPISEPVRADLMSCIYSWVGALFGGRSDEMCLFLGALARRSFRRALRRS